MRTICSGSWARTSISRPPTGGRRSTAYATANTDYYVNAPDSGTNVPVDVSETSVAGTAKPNPNDDMGYANFFNPAMQTFPAYGPSWVDTASAQIVYPFQDNQYCPPINVVPSSYQVFSAGAPLGQYPCGTPGTRLW
jgi:hypothetical protein